LGQSIDTPPGEAATENNVNGTVTVKYIDANGYITNWAILAQREDGIWEMIEKK